MKQILKGYQQHHGIIIKKEAAQFIFILSLSNHSFMDGGGSGGVASGCTL